MAALVAWSAPPLQEMEMLIPVECGQPPDGLAIASAPLHDLNVRVRGPRDLLSALAASPPPVYRQLLDGLNAGLHPLTVEKNRIALPPGITVVEVKPHLLIVNLEKKIYKQVPVVVSLRGRPATGFTVGDAVPDPPAVTLQGPRSLLEPLTKVFTKPVELTDMSDAFEREVALDLPANVEPLESDGIIVARISVVSRIVTQVFENVPVGARGSRMPWTITPTGVSLQIKGPEDMLEALRRDMDSRVYLDLAELKPGVYVRRAVIDLPPGVQLISAEPGLFTVTLKEK